MQALLSRLHEFDAVAFHDFSRFSRSIEFTFQFVSAAARLNVTIFDVAAGDVITVQSATDYIKTGFKAMIAEYESVIATDRMIRAYTRARENGWVWSRVAPLGLKVVGSRAARHVEPADDFPVAMAVIDLLAQGFSPKQIANTMRERGLKARSAKRAVTEFQVYHVVTVAGCLHWYRGFVDDELLNRAMRRVDERKNKKGPAAPRKHPLLILHGLLKCTACQRPWIQIWQANHPGESVRPYYRHIHSYICSNSRKIKAAKFDSQVFAMLERFIQRIESEGEKIHERVAEKQRAGGSADNRGSRRKELQARLTAAKQRMFNDFNLVSEYAEIKQQIEAEIATLDHAEPAMPVPAFTLEQIKGIITAADGWQLLAKANPREFNLMLKDLFTAIIVREDMTLQFVPHESLADYFEGIV